MNAATSAAIAAIIRMIGFASMTAFKAPNTGVRVPMTEVMVPTAEMTLPMTTRSGPIAAAISATLMMTCCTGSGMPLQICENDFRALEMSFSTGARAEARLFPMSAPVSFREFMVILNWSIGSSVSLKVFSTLPEKLPREPDRLSRFSFPVAQAL